MSRYTLEWVPTNKAPSGWAVAAIAAVAFVVALTLGVLYLERAEAASLDEPPPGIAQIEMPYCQTEDGSDFPGRYCMWVDPDTGHGYINPMPEEVHRGVALQRG